MTGELVLRISDVRTALEQVLRVAEARFGSEVRLPMDYYWHLPVEVAFDMAREPAEFTLGQLSDDLEGLAARDPDPAVVWHDLAHLIGLLRAIESLATP